MDAFAVSIAKGLATQQLRPKHYASVALWFGGFQALMPVVGYFLGANFASIVEHYDHWIAFTLLLFLGGKMIYEHFSGDASEKSFTPTRLAVILTLAVATSIDALAVGISFACLGLASFCSILVPILIIGITSFLFSLLGSILGATMGKRLRLNAELWGGILLIAIGTKILIEHLWA